jgi:hypothetical protein
MLIKVNEDTIINSKDIQRITRDAMGDWYVVLYDSDMHYVDTTYSSIERVIKDINGEL